MYSEYINSRDKVLSVCLIRNIKNPFDHLYSRVWQYGAKYKNANKRVVHIVMDKSGYTRYIMLGLSALPYTRQVMLGLS